MTRRLTLMHHGGIISWPNDTELRTVIVVDSCKGMESDYMVNNVTLDIENI